MQARDKILAALKSLDQHLGISREREQLRLAKANPACIVRVDRTIFTAGGYSADLILGTRRFHRERDYRLTPNNPAGFLPYQRIAIFEGAGSVKTFSIEYAPRLRRLPNCRVTVIPYDKSGLVPVDFRKLWGFFVEPSLAAFEIALDFGFASGVDGAFIRASTIFGKSRPRNVASIRAWDAWGSRRGTKWIRSYFKPELGVHRLEFQFHRSFLRRHGINTPNDLQRLVEIVPQHVLFARLDRTRVIRHLQRAGHSAYGIRKILEHVDDHGDDLLSQCRVLRRKGRLTNIRRMLRPLCTNGLIREALTKWAATWLTKP